MPDLDRFRAETRAWLVANCPPSMRTPVPDDEIVSHRPGATRDRGHADTAGVRANEAEPVGDAAAGHVQDARAGS